MRFIKDNANPRRKTGFFREWAHRDSNPEPTDYESAALTVELWALKWVQN